MKLQFSKIIIVILVTGYFTSCDSVKRVAQNEHILSKSTVYINGKKDNSEIINNLLYQRPNKKLLGVPLRLHIYNTARPNIDSIVDAVIYKTEKRKNKLEKFFSKKQVDRYKESRINFNNWLKKTGEAPVIVSEAKTKRTIKNLENYYYYNGWFDREISYDITKHDNKRASIDYQIKTGKPYIIDTLYSSTPSTLLDSIYQTAKQKSLIQEGVQYTENDLENERERLTKQFRNSGLYKFKQDNITFDVIDNDSTKTVDVDVKISNKTVSFQDSTYKVPFKIHTIKKVKVITDYTFASEGKPYQDSITYDGYNLYSYGKMRFRPKALTDAIFITKNNIFKDRDRTLTYRHLNELQTFKYPDIKYLHAEGSDNELITTIKLTPDKKFNLSFDADVSQSNIQTFGFSLNPSLQIRNIFRGAETLQISAIGSVGSSKDGKNDDDPFFDINEIGVDLKLTIPRLFFPFNTEKIIPKHMSPSTRISLATTNQTNIGLDKQAFNGIINYKWNPTNKITNRLDLFNAQYVRNLNIDNYFKEYKNSFNTLNNISKSLNYNSGNNLVYPVQTDAFINAVLNNNTSLTSTDADYKTISAINERKNRLTENNLILASNFSFTKNHHPNLLDENFSIFRFKLELAGNLLSNASKLLGLEKNSNDRYEVFNVAFSQYVKTEIDYIKHWDFGRKNILAMRGFFGIAIPYGNSTSIPFSKSFFAGGANDNRAWSAYSLGPGSSETTNEFNEANLKLALSVEQRFNIFEKINGALFIDAGNIWNVLDDVKDDNATFTGLNSLKDIAIGSGFGLRYDFSVFAFRLDIGFKTYDPFYRDKNRWFNDYNFSNAVYNIGINYPF